MNQEDINCGGILIMRKQVTVRLPVEMVRRIRHLAVDWDMDLGKAIERLLNKALEEVGHVA